MFGLVSKKRFERLEEKFHGLSLEYDNLASKVPSYESFKGMVDSRLRLYPNLSSLEQRVKKSISLGEVMLMILDHLNLEIVTEPESVKLREKKDESN